MLRIFIHKSIRLFAIAVVCSLVTADSIADINRIQAVGDQTGLWVVRREASQSSNTPMFSIWRRWVNDPPGRIEMVSQPRQGQVVPNGIAAHGDALWVTLESNNAGLAIHRMTTQQAGGPRQPLVARMALVTSLPKGIKLRSLAAGNGDLWTLVRVEDEHALQNIDKTQNDSQKIEKSTGRFIPTDRLLQFSSNTWQLIDLPDGWSDKAQGWIVSGINKNTMILAQQTRQPQQLQLWQFNDLQWNDLGRYSQLTDIQPLIVDNQLVIGQLKWEDDKVTLQADVIRSDTQNMLPIGSLEMDITSGTTCRAVSVGHKIALLIAKPDGQLLWQKMNLLGQVDFDQPTALQRGFNPGWAGAKRYIMFATVLALSMVVMLVFWQREQLAEQLDLPGELILADFGKRLLAGMVDLLPCVYIASLVYGVEIGRIFENWPLQADDWRQMWPGVLSVGLFILHTGVTELFTGTSMGKRLMRLHVTDLRGQPVHIWRVLARNIMKVFDLVMPPLILFIVLSPHRQRLGDLVARTVVVRKKEHK